MAKSTPPKTKPRLLQAFPVKLNCFSVQPKKVLQNCEGIKRRAPRGASPLPWEMYRSSNQPLRDTERMQALLWGERGGCRCTHCQFRRGVGEERAGEGLTRGGCCCVVSPSAAGSDPRLRGAAGRHCQHLRGLLREQDVSDPQREAHAPQGTAAVVSTLGPGIALSPPS